MTQCLDLENDLVAAVEFSCYCCGKLVRICRTCWRNQKYCSEACRVTAFKSRKSRNQKKYRSTEAGNKAHRSAQKRYRLHQKFQDSPIY